MSKISQGPKPPAGGGGSSKTGVIPPDPIRFLGQYKWVLLITALEGIALGVGLTKILARVSPQYTAQATVMVGHGLQDVYKPDSGMPLYENTMAQFKQTQAKLITENKTLKMALVMPIVQKDVRWFRDLREAKPDGTTGIDMQRALGRLSEAVTAVPEKGDYLIRVKVTAPYPEDAQILVNAVVDAYARLSEEKNAEEYTSDRKAFTSRLNEARGRIAELETEKYELLSGGDLAMIHNRRSTIEMNLQNLQTVMNADQQEMIRARRESQALQSAQRKAMQAAANNAPVYDDEDLVMVDNAQSVMRLKDRLRTLMEEKSVRLKRFGPDHRQVKDLDQRINEVRRQVNTERITLFTKLVIEAENRLAVAEGKFKDSQDQYNKEEQKYADLQENLNRYYRLKQEQDRLEIDIAQYKKSLDALSLAMERSSSRQVQVEQRATSPPDKPSFPRLRYMVAGCTLGMLSVIGGLLYLKEMFDQRIKSPSCFALLPKTSLLGVVPNVKEDPAGPREVELTVIRYPDGLLAETYRQLRNEILTRIEINNYKSVIFVGTQPEAGTSVVLTNVGASLAVSGHRVLMIDTNLRRPALHQIMDTPIKPGLAELLGDQNELHHAIHPTAIDGLDVLPVGEVSVETQRQMEGPVFRQMLRTLGERYEALLVDAPPMAIMGDSRLLANRVDASLLIVRAIKDKRGMAARLIRDLNSCSADMLGVVLNNARAMSSGYFRRNYEAFAKYQKNDDPADVIDNSNATQAGTESANTTKAGRPEEEHVSSE